MIEDIKNLLRHKLYEQCNILVNDLTEVIDEISIFIHEIIEPYVKNYNDRLVMDGIEILFENDKVVWKLFDNDYTNVTMLDWSNIKYVFNNKDEYIMKIKQKYEHYPKEFYGNSVLCFMATLSTILYNEELIVDEINVFDLCILHNNGKNNIIYEI